ncbi:MAG: hypothetical protein CO099_12290 [Bdellovibrio sp. CG_4_9_14_3_um_filter_39_7]|nr:MAG: hypothetical protein CO099_12290 [Bdellovibrio sp. CG_4_9_14_3_um_filter_39_7]
MKNIFLLFILLISNLTFAGEFDNKITGEIWWSKNEKGDGTLKEAEIVVKAYTLAKGLRRLLAETTIKKPSFPQLFLLGPKQTLIPGDQFVGPFEVEIKFIHEGKVNYASPMSEDLVPNGKRNSIFYLFP